MEAMMRSLVFGWTWDGLILIKIEEKCAHEEAIWRVHWGPSKVRHGCAVVAIDHCDGHSLCIPHSPLLHCSRLHGTGGWWKPQNGRCAAGGSCCIVPSVESSVVHCRRGMRRRCRMLRILVCLLQIQWSVEGCCCRHGRHVRYRNFVLFCCVFWNKKCEMGDLTQWTCLLNHLFAIRASLRTILQKGNVHFLKLEYNT